MDGNFELFAPPEFLRGEPCALNQCGQFRPDHLGVYLTRARLRRETAVTPNLDVLSSDQVAVVDRELGDELRVLNPVVAVAEHAGHDDLAVREFDLFEGVVILHVAWVHGLEKRRLAH